MKSSRYWDKRAIKRLNDSEKISEEYINRIKKIYEQSYRNIEREIQNVYKAYSKDTGLDIQLLKALLTKSETRKTWEQMKAQGLDQYIKNNYKSRISRLEQIQAQIYTESKKIFPKEELEQKMCYRGVVNQSYNRAIYDTQMGTGYDFSFNKLDRKLVDTVLNERWAGGNYSSRIWGNTDILANSLSEVLGGALLSGQSIEKTIKQIRDRFGVAKTYAERLVRTETNHFNNEADAMAYEEMGIKEYVFVATLDSRTSKICQEHDGKRYKYSDKQTGVNYPPLHPNCRSKTRGYIGEEAEYRLKRRAKDPITGKTELIKNIPYSEWIKNINMESSIEKVKKSDIITPSNLIEKLNINISDYERFYKYDSNDIQERASKLLKYDSKPTIVDIDTYNKTTGKELVRVVHEYNGITAQEVYNNTLYGQIKYSEAYNSSYGRGIYFGDSDIKDEIISTYSRGDSKVINAKLSNKTNILEFENQVEWIRAVTSRLRDVPKDLQKFYENENSLLFMLEGVDGIKIKNNGYYCIFNRGALITHE